MVKSLGYRVFLLLSLFILLGTLFVWAGVTGPNPAAHEYPGTNEVLLNPDQYVGQQVSVSGTVVSTEPLVIEATNNLGETHRFEITGETDAQTGDHLSAFGTLESTHHIDAENIVYREPWEAQYMYVVSFIAGLWVAGRLLNGWLLDTTDWTLEPRSDPPVSVRR